jgi:arylsulfatase A-like enzyme
MLPRLLVSILLLAVAAPLLAQPAPARAPLNVLLLTVDGVRTDHLGSYGYARPTTPSLDAFARDEAVRFAQAFAESPWTTPSIVSTLLGVPPAVHGIDTRRKWIDPVLPTWMRSLGQRGYHVRGYLAAGEAFGEIGFELPNINSEWIVDRLKGQEEPFFIWYHMRSAHLPFNHERFREEFARADSPPLPDPVRDLLLRRDIVTADEQQGWDPAWRPAVVDLYDADLRHLDEEISWAFDVLKERGLWERTVVVVIADHGEELMEHGLVGHASTTLAGTLYDEVMRIPLLIRVPGIPGGRVVDDLVQQIDILPTLVDLVGGELPSYVEGTSLVPSLDGSGSVERARVFFETTLCGWQCWTEGEQSRRLKAVRTAEWKLVVDIAPTGERQQRLFDLTADPLESRDVAADHPAVAAELAGALADREARSVHSAAEIARSVLERRIADLSSVPVSDRPKRVVDTCDRLSRLRYLYRQQTPSLFDDPQEREQFARRAARLVGLLGENAQRYWVCREAVAF